MILGAGGEPGLGRERWCPCGWCVSRAGAFWHEGGVGWESRGCRGWASVCTEPHPPVLVRAHPVPLRRPPLHEAERRPGPRPAAGGAGAGEGPLHRRRPGSRHLHGAGRHEAGARRRGPSATYLRGCVCLVLGGPLCGDRDPRSLGQTREEGALVGPRCWGRWRWSGLKIVIHVCLCLPQALNNVQSTFSGFGFINSENVFKVQEPGGPPGVLRSPLAAASGRLVAVLGPSVRPGVLRSGGRGHRLPAAPGVVPLLEGGRGRRAPAARLPRLLS